MSYKRVIISKFGEPEVLQLIEESKLPEPQSGEARIRILRASANFTDVMIRKGKYIEVKDKPPFSPGYDMVGEIDHINENTSNFKVGDRVACLTVIGSYSEYICLPINQLVAVPKNLDPAEATSLILTYTTAYQMLHRVAKVENGKSILIHGASGAVGIAMLQLGQLLNLKMYGTASKEKHDLVTKYGGIPIDYKSEDFEEKIKTLTENGVDAVFDAIGGDNFKKSFNTLKPGGILVAYGFYNAVMGKGGNMALEFFKLVWWNILPNKKKTKFYIITRLRKKHPEWFQEDLTSLFQLLSDGKIKPEIEEQLPLDKAVEVHHKIEQSSLKGKVVFTIAD